MLEYLNNNLSGFWIALGFALLAAEVFLFGFTTIIFLFAGLGAIITGLLMMAGVLPETWIAGVSSFGIATGISSAVLWKPMMLMQGKSAAKQKPSSDFVGLEFVLAEDISTATPGSYRYSGVDWKVVCDSSSDDNAIAKGQRVVVVAVQVGLLYVTKK
jgi:hypothetical protein